MELICVSHLTKPHGAKKAVHSHGHVTFCWSSNGEAGLRNQQMFGNN